ncbi:hypothetical protein NKG94_06165 [Micromonospora sp. M12]
MPERDARPGAGQAGDGDRRRVPATPTRTDLTNVQTPANGLSWWHQISGYGATTTVRTTPLSKPTVGSRRTWAAVNLTRRPAPPSRTATTSCTSTRAARWPTPPSG